MNSVQQTIARIRAFAASQKWSKTKYAKEAGIPDTTLRHFHNEAWNPTAVTLERLESIIPKKFSNKPQSNRS